MALGLSSWDLGPTMMAEPVNCGGVATYPLEVWVRYQFGQLFHGNVGRGVQIMGERCGAITESAVFPIPAAGCNTTATTHMDSSVMPSVFSTASESGRAPTGGLGGSGKNQTTESNTAPQGNHGKPTHYHIVTRTLFHERPSLPAGMALPPLPRNGTDYTNTGLYDAGSMLRKRRPR